MTQSETQKKKLKLCFQTRFKPENYGDSLLPISHCMLTVGYSLV